MIAKSQEDILNNLIARLEVAVNKLENKTTPQNTAQNNLINISDTLLSAEKLAAFSDYWNKTLKSLVELKAAAKETNIPQIETITEFVIEAICAHQDVLLASEVYRKPVNNDLQNLYKSLLAIINKLKDSVKDERDFSLHVDAVKNGLDSIFWVFSDNSCDELTKTYFESIDFAGNKIMMKKIPEQTKWLKAFKSVIKEIVDLVKSNYKNGLVWTSKGQEDINAILLNIGNTYRKNFKKQNNDNKETKDNIISNTDTNSNSKTDESNKKKINEQIIYSEIRKSLKPITPPTNTIENKTENKVESKTTENKKAEVKTKTESSTSSYKVGRRQTLTKKGPKEIFEEMRSSFIYENLEDLTKELDAEKLANKTVIQISNCINCTFKVPKKVNAIKLTNCENVNIVCNSLITLLEIINSLNIKVGVEGCVNSFGIDGSENVVLHLNSLSSNAQIISSKSSEVKVRLVKEEDECDYDELIIPEQFVFSIQNRKIQAKVSDLYS